MYAAYKETLFILKGMSILSILIAIPTGIIFYAFSFLSCKEWPLIALCIDIPVVVFTLIYMVKKPFIERFFEFPEEDNL